MSNTRIYWLHTLSPTHVGVGRGVGYIDLPIERENITGWPIIRGSAFKGVWADHHRATADARRNNPTLRAAFGIAGDDNHSNAGALIPTDAKMVCLPIRSFRGTFAWATSSLCLQMVRRAMVLAGEHKPPDVPTNVADSNALHVDGDGLQTTLKEGGNIYLEDLDFVAQPCPATTQWAAKIAESIFPGVPEWQVLFKKRFVVLPDMAFDYLCDIGTEVHTRVKIDDETKVVSGSALWTEESLPAETILMGVVQCDRIFGRDAAGLTPGDLLGKFASGELGLQIGGKATVGRGQVRCLFSSVDRGVQ